MIDLRAVVWALLAYSYRERRSIATYHLDMISAFVTGEQSSAAVEYDVSMGKAVGVVELSKTRKKIIECQGGPLPLRRPL